MPENRRIIGLDPDVRLASVLAHALSHHADAAALILMGDLTHYGNKSSYTKLQTALADCPVPVIPMLGNHDNRETFQSVFPDAPRTASGHVQHIMDLAHHRIITLDSLDGPPYPQGHHSGRLCADRLDWLDDALAGSDGRMPLVFVHHPPMDTGIVGMDQIKLVHGDDLLVRLKSHKAHLFFGHLHRNFAGSHDGVPWTTFKSPCHQGPLDLADPDSSLSIDEPAGYGVILLPPKAVIAHMQDVGLDAMVHQDTGSHT